MRVSGPPNAALRALNFCVGATPFSLSSLGAVTGGPTQFEIFVTSGVFFTCSPGDVVSLSIGPSCPQAADPTDAPLLLGLVGASSTDGGATFDGALRLSPAGAAAYAATAPGPATHVELTPLADHAANTVEAGVQGGTLTALSSGMPSAVVELEATGESVIEVKATPRTGGLAAQTWAQTWAVTVRRAAGTEWATLAGRALPGWRPRSGAGPQPASEPAAGRPGRPGAWVPPGPGFPDRRSRGQ